MDGEGDRHPPSTWVIEYIKRLCLTCILQYITGHSRALINNEVEEKFTCIE